MSKAAGTWNVEVKSPQGVQKFTLVLTDDPVSGSGVGPDGEQQDLDNVAFEGDTVTFATDVVKPMKLRIVWTLTAEGDTLRGTAKAGFFPSAKVSATRASVS